MVKPSIEYKLTEKAFHNKELRRLLLGEEPYRFYAKYSPAIDIDLALLIPHGIYTYALDSSHSSFSQELYEALQELAKEYIGIIPVASFILIESFERMGKKSPLEFDLISLARELNCSIYSNIEKLSKDKRGDGHGWDDGKLGELRNMAKNTVSYGGPDFFGLE